MKSCTQCEPQEIAGIEPLVTWKSRNFDLKVKERVTVGISSLSASLSSISAATGTQSVVWSQASPIETTTSSSGRPITCLPVQLYRRPKAISFVPLDGGKDILCGCLLCQCRNLGSSDPEYLGVQQVYTPKNFRCDLRHGP